MNSCEVKGTVVDKINEFIFIEIIPDSACSSCGVKSMCGSGKSRVIRIENYSNFEKGDSLLISIRSKLLIKITFALYFMGLIFAAFLSYLLFLFFNFSENSSALIFIVFILAYLPVTSLLLSKKLSNKLTYIITKNS